MIGDSALAAPPRPNPPGNLLSFTVRHLFNTITDDDWRHAIAAARARRAGASQRLRESRAAALFDASPVSPGLRGLPAQERVADLLRQIDELPLGVSNDRDL